MSDSPTRRDTRPLFDAWRDWATAHARAGSLPSLAPLVEGLTRSTAQLRAADWNDDAGRRAGGDPERDAAE